VSFRAETHLPARALVPLVGRHLPADLAVRVAAETGADFDARRSACARRYVYRLLGHDDPLWRRYAWHPTRPLEPEGFDRAVGALVGEHDFAAFEASGSSPAATTCRLIRAGWLRWEAGWMLELVADHFLYHMVRNIVGTALAVMRERDPAAAMRTVLETRRRGAGGATAPPEGLCLEEVLYPS
jgi:tRNA pseudouridine38-40 synthase